MVSVEQYRERYAEEIHSRWPELYEEIRNYRDIFSEDIVVAVDEEEGIVGAGYLYAGTTFGCIERELPYYHVQAEFKVDTDAECAGEAVECLVEDLKERFRRVAGRYPEKRLILRIWCPYDHLIFMEYLMDMEFRAGRLMSVMRYELCDFEEDDEEESSGSFVEELDIGNPDVMQEYLRANEKAFGIPDSASLLLYQRSHRKAKVYAVRVQGEIAACVTTWEISSARAATENIFCIPEYQGQGLGTAIICHVLNKLKNMGYEEAELTVFGDNIGAAGLYLSLGYYLEHNLVSMEYEPDYEPLPF